MGRSLNCDICKKPTDAIVAKLFYGPLSRGSAKAYHSNYSHHLDCGVCCADKILLLFNWQKRISAREYNSRRKSGMIK
jgi:hypothetical protein